MAKFFDDLIDRATKLKFRELGNIYWAYTQFLFQHFEYGKAIEAGLIAEKSFINVIQKLKDEEAVLTRKDREFDKTCNKILQLCYVFSKLPQDAILVSERGKTRYVDISLNKTSNKQITIEIIRDIAFRIN